MISVPENPAKVRIRKLQTIQKPVIDAIVHTLQTQEAGTVLAVCGFGKTRVTADAITKVIAEGASTVAIIVPSKRILEQWENTFRNLEFTAGKVIGISSDSGAAESSGKTRDLEEILSANSEKGQNEPLILIITNASCHHLIPFLGKEVLSAPESKKMLLLESGKTIESLSKSTELMLPLQPQFRTFDFIVFDEAHHMAGSVAEDNSGFGRTRRLLAETVRTKTVRLFLTFTPRNVFCAMNSRREKEVAEFEEGKDQIKIAIASMDNSAIFGPIIANISLRFMIEQNLLPDYDVVLLKPPPTEVNLQSKKLTATSNQENLAQKAFLIATAFVEKKIKKLLVFSDTVLNSVEFTLHFQSLLEQLLPPEEFKQVYIDQAEAGDDLDSIIELYTDAPRAILTSCFVLGEGVDIPCSDATCITYLKKSESQIIQMILRAGRWYPEKERFAILIPVLGGADDWKLLEEILCCLSEFDPELAQKCKIKAPAEIIKSEGSDSLKIWRGKNGKFSRFGKKEDAEVDEEEIVNFSGVEISSSDSTAEAIRALFSFSSSEQSNTFPKLGRASTVKIQRWCSTLGINTSLDYRAMKREGWDSIPLRGTQTWFDFLNPGVEKIGESEFRELLKKERIGNSREYDEWLRGREENADLPTLQNILDGYFGKNFAQTNFLNFLAEQKFANFCL